MRFKQCWSTIEMLQFIGSVVRQGLLCATMFGALASGSPVTAAAACTTPALAFRFDDVQDYWLSDAQTAVIEVFAQHDFPLTLAIIGGFFGEDRSLVETIRRHKGQLEIANHGWHAKNDTDGRSILLSQSPDETRKQVEHSGDRIKDLLGVEPDIYIPHKNQFNYAVLHALELLGFRYISSACSWHLEKPTTCEDLCGYADDRTCTEPDAHGLIHVPVGASTQWEPAPGKGWASPQDVLDEIRRSTDRYGFAVVMLHPQDFVHADKSVNPQALEALRQLLSEVQEADTHRVVTLSQVSGSCEP